MSNLTKCASCGAVMNPSWGKCLVCHSPKNQSEISEQKPIPKCVSVQYSPESGYQTCGSGFICDRCNNPGSDLKTVYFFSEKLDIFLDLKIPEKDRFIFEKIMEAREDREKYRIQIGNKRRK